MEPPLVGVAVNVTLVPAQIVVALAAILTLAVNIGLTVIEILLDVAGEPVKHGVAFEVITTLTEFPLVNVEEVNVALFVPTGVAPTYHW